MIREFADSERDSYLAAENARLKRELAQQKEALEILKKAATDFAKYQKWSVLSAYLSSDEHTITWWHVYYACRKMGINIGLNGEAPYRSQRYGEYSEMNRCLMLSITVNNPQGLFAFSAT